MRLIWFYLVFVGGIALSAIRAIVLVGPWVFEWLGVVCICDTSARSLNSGCPCYTYVREVVVFFVDFRVCTKSITLYFSCRKCFSLAKNIFDGNSLLRKVLLHL